MAVNAMKSGAADFIQKPFRDQELLDRIHNALARDRETRKWRGQGEGRFASDLRCSRRARRK